MRHRNRGIMFCLIILMIGGFAAEGAKAADDPRVAKMMKLPLAGKFSPGELFRVRPGDRFNVEFLKGEVIRKPSRVEIVGSPYIWTVDPTIMGVHGNQVKLEGYNPAEANGTGVCNIQFTLRTDGLWLFVVYGDKSTMGVVELVEEKDTVNFLATTRKDGKVNGALFQFVAKNLRVLREEGRASKEFEKYVDPVLAPFGVGIT